MGDANIGEPIQECGECSDCNNYRDISLLKNVSKVFARVIAAGLVAIYIPFIDLTKVLDLVGK